MNENATIPTDLERSFWRCAGEFPANKEIVYPDHAAASGFDDLGGEGVRVLEYGCGGGADAMSWLRRGCHVDYADVVAENVEAARRRISEMDPGLGARVRSRGTWLEVGDRLPEGPFDVVHSHGVLHHVPDPAAILRAMRRVLRPEGRLVVMLYSPALREHHGRTVDHLMRKHGIPEEAAFGWCTDGAGCPRARSYSVEQARELLGSCGFALERSVPSNQGFFLTHRARVA